MGVIINKKEKETELTRRISADLRARAIAEEKTKDPDFAEDSEYVKDFKKTGSFGWVWFVLIALALISLIIIITI